MRLVTLAWDNAHRDRFDHLLLAQAAVEAATFVSADAQLGRYGVPLLNCG